MIGLDHDSTCFEEKTFSKPVVLPPVEPDEAPVGYIVEWCGTCGVSELRSQFYP